MQIYREITPLQDPDVYVILDSVNNDFDYPIHNHPEFELNLVMGCSGTRIVGDSTEMYYLQDLVLIGPYLFHKWDIDKSQEFNQHRVITIQFKMDLFNSDFFRKSLFSKIRKLLQDASRAIKFHGNTFNRAAEMMIGLTENTGFSRMVQFLELLDLLSSSRETTFLASEGFSPHAIPSKGNRIQIAYGYILRNFHKKTVRIEDVAQLLNMSISAFSHFFKKYTNKSFSQFLIDVRIGHACKLLLETDEDVRQVCYNSGFNNVANFNRLFKKYRSCTPLEFRRRDLEKGAFDWTKQVTPGQFIPSENIKNRVLWPSDFSTTRVMHV
ncbi:MAG: helix-turn-helix domain-containing protein [Saprospiraceae bacterium]|nr:helix-turn-helix domain-containing protein [Saprospiraceae bacterium]MCB9322556.1 helix-turn-helix transcriptional regulator [Lewinellaceae bacterium]